MPVTTSGIEYDQLFTQPGGQLAYSEAFARDANVFSAYLACKWEDVQDFRRDILGYTERDPSNNLRFNRTLPHLCPYTSLARAFSMTLVNYGRRPEDAEGFDAEAAAIDPSNTDHKMPFFADPETEDWFTTHRAIYRVDYQRLPYQLIDDATLDSDYQISTPEGIELSRYVTRQWTNIVRELRTPDYNFKVEGTDTVLKVNGFIPYVESEIVYTWYQVPFQDLPLDTINDLRLTVNENDFDDSFIVPSDDADAEQRTPKEPETMLFVDAKGIDLPYQGPDGGLYFDVQYLFKQKRVKNSSGDIKGHNHVLDAAGNWQPAVRINSGARLYQRSSRFHELFTPKQL